MRKTTKKDVHSLFATAAVDWLMV